MEKLREPSELCIPQVADEFRGRTPVHPHGDIYWAALAEAMVDSLDPDSPNYNAELCSTVEFAWKARTAVHGREPFSAEFANLIERSLQVPLQESDLENGYPDSYDRPEPWTRQINKLMAGEDAAEYERFVNTLVWQELMTDRPERMIFPALIVDALVGNNANVADFGTARMIGLKHYAMSHLNRHWNGFMPFGAVEILDENDQFDPIKSERIKRRAAAGFAVNQCIGIDQYDINEDAFKVWGRNSTITPAERAKNIAVADNYDMLDAATPDNTTFVQADAAELDINDIAHIIPAEGIDVVFYRTCLYQSSEGKTKKMLDKGLELNEGKRVRIVQDFAIKNPARPKELIFVPDWFDWHYNTFLIDESDDIHHLFSSRTSRCRQTRLGPDIEDFGIADKLGLST
jgi:hypothetical protein